MRASDYQNYGFDELMIGQHSFYVPNKGDQTGYAAFPSTSYGKRLNEIELRGDTLYEEFHMKNIYKDGFVSTYGYIWKIFLRKVQRRIRKNRSE